MNKRIIARLDIKGPNLVKGIQMEGLRVLGKPEDFARHYYQSGADELVYMDVVASLYNRNSLHEIISRTAREVFIPLAVGGGLRSIEDIRSVLRAGADKIVLNTAAIKTPELVREAARVFGSSTIVIGIEAIRQPDGRYHAFVNNGRQETGIEVVNWAKQVEQLGVGEILISCVDREGTGLGFDLNLVNQVADAVNVPVIAHGGPGKLSHIIDAFREGHADAVALSSMLHYHFISSHPKEVLIEGEGNTEFLKSGKVYSKIAPIGIPEIKARLIANGIPCRHNLDLGYSHE